MKYTNQKLGNPGICLLLCVLLSALAAVAAAQAFGTTTVQGTVYLANGAPGSGTLQLSWPAFTTASNQAVAAGRTTVSIASDGFVSVKLAPNVGAMPAGLFYTAVYHLSDGTTSTEYWVVPAAAQAALAQVRAQVMPAAQAVQAVNKAYVDQSIAQLVQSQVTSSGGSLTGPLYLNGDPVTSPQAATKHYVDAQVGQTLSVNGGAANGPLTATQLGAAFQADQFPGSDFGAKLQACISAIDSSYGGSCDARNFSGTLAMGSNLTIAKGNVTINLPCATIATSSQIVVTAGTRNVTLHGCASRGTSAASGSQGGSVFLYSGSAAMIQVGDATYAADTLGFHLDNVVLNTTPSAAATAQAVKVWRAQEVHLESLYLLGNANQTGITLDGTGNYTGGTFQDVEIGGFQTALNAIGHQVANAATTDWLNASTFVRMHIYCPTANGNAIAGTTGINLAQGDGDTFTGGDVESCATALHLGPNAQNNTIVGLRNENSTYQVVADTGSAYNNWITGGTMFTGKLTDNGTRNSFLDTFHRSFNALNGDWFGSQQDSTITNHYRLGIGSGNERGLLHRYQTDSGYRWTMGLSDATAGEQYYTVLDELNNVNRLSIGQYNTGQGSSNNQTVVNAAGTGAVVLNGSNNAGSGGVVFGSGGPASTTVATINNAGNAQFNGSLQVSGPSTFLNSTSIKNQADAEIDAFLWAGATAPQKESVVYKDFNGNSQWYMVKDTSNNWALNSAVGGVDSFKAYQSNNSGDTYIDAANNTGVVRVNYEPGSGSAFNVYGGSSGSLYASFNGTTGIKFPGLAAGSGKNCVQIDNSGYLSNTGSSCAGSSVGAGTTGQIAYYPGNGSTLAGVAAVPIGSGGTGATSASAALASLGGLPASGGTLSGPLTGSTATFSGDIQAQNVSVGSDRPTGHQAASANAAVTTFSVLAYGAVADATSSDYLQTFSLTAGSNVLTATGAGFTPASVGKWACLNDNYLPWTTVPWSGGAPYCAQIASYVDSNHVGLNVPPASVNSTSGLVRWGTDNTPAFNACRQAVEATITRYSNNGGTCVIPTGTYLLATAPTYMFYTGNNGVDDGSYGTSAGGTGAVLSCPVSGGSITSCSVSNGGSGYTANSTLQTSINGGCPFGSPYDSGSCGWAWVTATTNGSGSVTGATVVYPGFGFISAPTATVLPLGGDGAAATVSLTGGATGTPTLTAAGSGYGSAATLDYYLLAGSSGCSVRQTIPGDGIQIVGSGTATLSGGAATGAFTVTASATGCSSAPAVVFGDVFCNTGTASSPVWGQCHNMAPLVPLKTPVQVGLSGGVNFRGSMTGGALTGVALVGNWDKTTVDNNQAAMFGGYANNTDIGEFNIMTESMIGLMSPALFTSYSKLHDIAFNSGIGLLTAGTDIQSRFDNLSFGGYASWINGGMWTHRLDFPLGLGGQFDANSVSNIIARVAPYGGPGSISQRLDDWYANNIWHPEYSGASNDWPSGEVCKFPQTVNQRQTSRNVNIANGGYTANTMCYRGVSSLGMAILVRDGRATGGAKFDSLIVKQASRYIFYGSVGGMIMTNWGCEGCAPLTGSSDPYRAASTQEGGIVYTGLHGSNLAYPTFNSIGVTGNSNVTQMLWNIMGAGNPTQTIWTNNMGGSVNNYQALTNPNFVDQISFPAGISLPVSTSLGQSGPIDIYNNDGAGNYLLDFRLQSESGGAQVLTGHGTPTRTLDITASGFTSQVPVAAPSLTLNGGTQATGTMGNGGKLQETTSAAKTSGSPVAWDANGNTVDANAANVVSLFSGCSGTQYLSADGSCHTPTGSSGAMDTTTPGWLHYLGTGADGANLTANGNLSGDLYYTNFTVPFGNTVTTNGKGLTIHATGTCTIAGSILATGAQQAAGSPSGLFGGASGGSGGGTNAGTLGNTSTNESLNTTSGMGGFPSLGQANGGAASGGNGANSTNIGCGNGVCNYTDFQRQAVAIGAFDSLFWHGANGVQGANSGGAGGNGGSHVTLICNQIMGTDGTHTGVIDVSGANGMPAAANNTGSGSGGGGGVAVLSSQGTVSTWPRVYNAPGPGALSGGPEALALSGAGTSPAKATLGVSGGALNGTCTVVQAGAGYGSGTGVTWSIVGGGGTAGTATINPTWSGGALASCTVTPGTSSGFTAASYTTSGNGGDGGAGWLAEFAGW